jgi:hypothetical protein
MIVQSVTRIGEDGREFTEKISSRVLRAKYTDNDVSWLAMEKEKWTNIFRPKDKQIMWMFVVIAVTMVLSLGGFLWGVNKNADVAESNLAIASQQATSNAIIAETLCVITEKCLNNTESRGIQQPFNTIITT